MESPRHILQLQSSRSVYLFSKLRQNNSQINAKVIAKTSQTILPFFAPDGKIDIALE